MRTNGDGGERFTARFTAEPANEDEDGARDERDVARTAAKTLAAPEPVPASSTTRSTKGPKSRVKKGKSQPPKAVEKAAPKQAEKTVAKQPEKPVAKPEAPSEKPAAKPEAPAKAAVVTKPAEKPARPSSASSASGKRGKSKSAAPKSRSTPAPPSVTAPVAASTPAPAPAPASAQPLSLDPRTTLRDHPVQKSAAAAARAATTPRRDDEISIPPTSSDPPLAGDLDERFFAEGEAAAHAAHVEAIRATKVGVEPLHSGDHDAHETGRRVVFVPPERRRKMANYVKVAVGFSAVLLLAAAVRVGIAHVRPTEAAAAVTPVVAVIPPPPPPREVEPVQAAPALATPAPAAVAPVAAAVEPPPPVPVDEPAAATEPAPPAKTAKQEKEDARKSLERGKRKDAIESAQRSVDLDPTDAEAWLILGSAQQDSGNWKEAHESFVACTKQAKAGPIGECRMMLR